MKVMKNIESVFGDKVIPLSDFNKVMVNKLNSRRFNIYNSKKSTLVNKLHNKVLYYVDGNVEYYVLFDIINYNNNNKTNDDVIININNIFINNIKHKIC